MAANPIEPLDRARRMHLRGQLLVLREVHAGRVETRADLTHRHGMARGSASEIVARLRDARLLAEQPAGSDGRRGRPTVLLAAHPHGPLVCALDVGHERWQAGLIELGGSVITRVGRHHDPAAGGRDPAVVLRSAASAVRRLVERAPGRVVAVSIAVAGVVRGHRIVQASTLGWQDVDLTPFFRDRRPGRGSGPGGKHGSDHGPWLAGVPLLLGNDATLAGLAEARRGPAADVPASLHLTIGVGIGGVYIVDGRPQTGATGAGGEFGHLPFGDPTRPCPCGARGCWDLDIDGRALARLLGRTTPTDPRTYAEEVLARAAGGDEAATQAVRTVAESLGRGIGALTNALDPALITLAGLGADLRAAAAPALDAGYHGALMAFRRDHAPPVHSSTVPEPVLTGAAEAGFDAFLTEDGIHRWRSANGQPADPVSPDGTLAEAPSPAKRSKPAARLAANAATASARVPPGPTP